MFPPGGSGFCVVRLEEREPRISSCISYRLCGTGTLAEKGFTAEPGGGRARGSRTGQGLDRAAEFPGQSICQGLPGRSSRILHEMNPPCGATGFQGSKRVRPERGPDSARVRFRSSPPCFRICRFGLSLSGILDSTAGISHTVPRVFPKARLHTEKGRPVPGRAAAPPRRSGFSADAFWRTGVSPDFCAETWDLRMEPPRRWIEPG
jgi:hypothetical protein